LKKPRGREPRYKPEDLVGILGNRFMVTNAFEKRARQEIGVTRSTFFVLLKKCEKAGLISKSTTTEEWETVNK
jgi:hypothetical protein